MNSNGKDFVGPVLISSPISLAIIEVIQKLNKNVIIQDSGSYIRISVKKSCILTRQAIEEQLGQSFSLVRDLEPIMVSFKGHLTLNENIAIWNSDRGELK